MRIFNKSYFLKGLLLSGFLSVASQKLAFGLTSCESQGNYLFCGFATQVQGSTPSGLKNSSIYEIKASPIENGKVQDITISFPITNDFWISRSSH